MQNRRKPASAGSDDLATPGEPRGAGPFRLSSPAAVFVLALALIFLAEAAVMALLHALSPEHGWMPETIADSSLLVLVVTPPMWWLISRSRRAEEALRRREEHFRSLIENASDIITVLALDGTIRFASPSVGHVLGYQPAEMLGRNVFSFLHPDDLKETLARFHRLLDDLGGQQKAEFRFRHADGSWRVLEAIGKNATSNGAEPSLIINSRDVTERKQAGEALRESEERFRKIFEEGPLGMAIVGLDRRFARVNEAFCNMVGYAAEELSTLTFADITHPDHVLADVQAADQLFKGEIPFYRVDKRYVRKDGQPIWVTLTASIIRASDGEPMHYLAMVQDIGDFKRLEESLRAKEEQTRLIVETASDAFISIDARGTITAWNAAAESVFGWSRQDAMGRPLRDTIIPPQHRDAHTAGLHRFLATGDGPVLNNRTEITAVHRDGHEFPVELAVWAVRSGDDWTFHAFVHDVTLRKEAEDALRRLNSQLEAERNTVRHFNRLLEAKVRERTRDLRRANFELRERNRQLLDARAQAATDGLTGLGNHRSFQEHIRKKLSAAGPTGSLALIMLDIDGFKRINDSLGHQTGDGVLRACAHAFATVVGEESVFRYGGDEFAVILPDSDIERAAEVAEQLRLAVQNIPAPVSISLGVASYPETAGSPEQLIYQADSAMYAAKMAGKNRACRWDRMPTAEPGPPSRHSAPVV